MSKLWDHNVVRWTGLGKGFERIWRVALLCIQMLRLPTCHGIFKSIYIIALHFDSLLSAADWITKMTSVLRRSITLKLARSDLSRWKMHEIKGSRHNYCPHRNRWAHQARSYIRRLSRKRFAAREWTFLDHLDLLESAFFSFLQMPHVPPNSWQCLHAWQFLHALQGSSP